MLENKFYSINNKFSVKLCNILRKWIRIVTEKCYLCWSSLFISFFGHHPERIKNEGRRISIYKNFLLPPTFIVGFGDRPIKDLIIRLHVVVIVFFLFKIGPPSPSPINLLSSVMLYLLFLLS